MRTGGFSFDIEILAIANKMGLTIKEMPVVVNFSRNKGDRSKISIKSIFVMARDTFKVKIHVSKLNLSKNNDALLLPL